MSEEEIIKTVDNFLDGYRQYNVKTGETYIPYKYGEGQKFCYVEDFEAIQGLLDLYTKEQEKNKFINEVKAIGTDDVVNVVLTKSQYEYLLERATNGFNKEKEKNKNSISKDEIKALLQDVDNTKFINKHVKGMYLYNNLKCLLEE